VTDRAIAYVILAVAFAVLAYMAGEFLGASKQRDQWQHHMDRCNRYIYAVDDLDRWCGSASPHARLIARHLRAHGEGLGCNAGTPTGDEACDIDGLRQQLARLDAKAQGGASHGIGATDGGAG
jgi:hypothetical protein